MPEPSRASTPPSHPPRILHERFVIPSRDGYPLRGDVRYRQPIGGKTPDSTRTIVGCHGFKGFKDWGFWPEIGKALAHAGYVAVTFNFAGSGIGEDLETFSDPERFERATLSGDLDDLGRILDAAAGGRLPGPRMGDACGVLGHSRGGAVGLLRAAADSRIGALVTWAAVSGFDRWDEETLRQWRERGSIEVVNARTGQVFHLRTDFLDDFTAHSRGRLDVERAAGAIVAPHLIVHGTSDETVPIAEARALAAWGRGQLHLVEGAGHTFGAVHPFAGRTAAFDDAIAATIAFFDRHLSGRSAPEQRLS
jgi:pimeloyl-ACP methyl ester carboxylesterase